MYSFNSRAALPDHLHSGRALWGWNFSNRDEITSKATFEWLWCYLSRPYNKASEPLIGTSYIRLLVCSEAPNFFPCVTIEKHHAIRNWYLEFKTKRFQHMVSQNHLIALKKKSFWFLWPKKRLLWCRWNFRKGFKNANRLQDSFVTAANVQMPNQKRTI